MRRVGLSERKASESMLDDMKTKKRGRIARYADYIIFNNVIILCEGEDSNEAFKICDDLINILSK